jgi:hypothetical protein
MPDLQLLEYIKFQYINGVPKEEIIQNLTSKGINYQSIVEILAIIENPTIQNPTITDMDSKPSPVTPLPDIQNKPKKRNKKLIIILALLLSIILVVAGGAFIYLTYFPAPEIVLFQAVKNASKVNSVEFASNTTIDISTKEDATRVDENAINKNFNIGAKSGNLRFDIEGSYDQLDPKNQKSALQVKASGNLDATFASNYKFAIELENRIIGDKGYAALTNGPKETDVIKNQWLGYELTEFKKNVESNSTVSSIKSNSENPISAENQKKLDEQNAKIFKITKNLPEEKINGANSYHFQYSVDTNEIKNYSILSREVKENKPLSQSEKDELSKSFDQVTPLSGDIWIGKSDYFVYKITAKTQLSLGANIAEINSSLIFKNYNQPIKVEKPEKVFTFPELAEKIYPQPKPALQANIIDATPNIDSKSGVDKDGISCKLKESYKLSCDTTNDLDIDGDGLTNKREFELGTNPTLVDTDTDGYSDGDEVKNGYNPNGDGKLDN